MLFQHREGIGVVVVKTVIESYHNRIPGQIPAILQALHGIGESQCMVVVSDMANLPIEFGNRRADQFAVVGIVDVAYPVVSDDSEVPDHQAPEILDRGIDPQH